MASHVFYFYFYFCFDLFLMFQFSLFCCCVVLLYFNRGYHALFVFKFLRVVPSGCYRVGNKITWHTFCSASLSMEVTKSFMIDKTTGVCSGTLFIIKDTVCGCDVQPFSFMPEKGKTATQLKTTTI